MDSIIRPTCTFSPSKLTVSSEDGRWSLPDRFVHDKYLELLIEPDFQETTENFQTCPYLDGAGAGACDAAGAGAETLMLTFLFPLKIRPPKTNSAATTTITKITSTATTPVLPLPPSSPIFFSSCRFTRRSFHRRAVLELHQSHNSNQLPKQSKQMPVQSLPVARVSSSACPRQTLRPALRPDQTD